jgi:hypothetical protein
LIYIIYIICYFAHLFLHLSSWYWKCFFSLYNLFRVSFSQCQLDFNLLICPCLLLLLFLILFQWFLFSRFLTSEEKKLLQAQKKFLERFVFLYFPVWLPTKKHLISFLFDRFFKEKSILITYLKIFLWNFPFYFLERQFFTC